MSLISEHIIPGPNGRVFRTDAIKHQELETIKKRLLTLEGIESVDINMETFPREITVYTSKLVSVKDVEMKAKTTSFHAILRDSMEL